MGEILRPSGEWVLLLGIEINDPDGWDRTDFNRSWFAPISAAEFRRRASLSTIWARGDI